MPTPGVSALLAATIAVFLVVVFSIERRRGKRFAEPVRNLFDRLVTGGGTLSMKPFAFLRSGVFRQGIHTAFHLVLASGLALFRRVTAWLERMLRSNRTLARKAKADRERTHLDDISDHKEASALTEAEKTARRRNSLEGRS